MALKPSRLALSIALGIVLPGAAFAEVSTFGYIKNETSFFTMDGSATGAERSAIDNKDRHDAGDVLKFENSARLFVNGDISENAVWHADLNLIYDSEAISNGGVEYKGYRLYSQHDWLKELYVDAYTDNWDFRLGKQQVVWGTADGIKLLDIINPTDYREVVQNQFEDSRIPIWMVKAERNIGDASNVQFIVSQHEENKFPGLNSDGDSGHPFIFKGVDTITGRVNGFLNVAPNLANVAGSFSTGAALGLINGAPSPFGLVPTSGLTVEGFAGPDVQIVDADGNFATSFDQFIQLRNPATGLFDGPPPGGAVAPGSNTFGYFYLNNIAQNGLAAGDPNGNNSVTNLMPVSGTGFTDVSWSPGKPTSAFEYMSNATFATFNSFATCLDAAGDGCDPTPVAFGGDGDFITGATTRYRRDYPDDTNLNAGLRLRQRLPNGFNFSLNYFYHYSANPEVNLSWHDAVTGEQLQTQRAPAGDFINNGTGAPGPDGTPDLANFTQSLSVNQVPGNLAPGSGNFPTTVLLRNGTGQYYGAYDPTGGQVPGGHNTNPVELRFTERLHRVHSIGASFDYAVNGLDLPVVLRGEFLYDKDEKQPVIDKRLLSIGDLENALKMEDADWFKYVLGVDVTVLTNMLISGQFIQFRNLDYVDNSRTCTTQTGIRFDCSKYTGDFASMHLSNGLKKDYENKEFYSIFFSKPFGPSDEHRWNNITIFEEGGGKWNRFDVEYTFSDRLIGTAEWNHYWGDEDTQFGQFHDSSNLQVGLKYIFE